MPTQDQLYIIVVYQKRKQIYLGGYTMLTSNVLPIGAIPMTAIITICNTDIETQLINQTTGNTVQTNYHSDLEAAVEYLNQFSVDKIEYDCL